MKDFEDLFWDEQWDKILEEIAKDKSLIRTINLDRLAGKRLEYQLVENGKEDALVYPYGEFSDLIKLIEYCKKEGMLGVTIPQATAFQQLEQIEALLKERHHIDEEAPGERSGLLIAAALNDFELVKFFIENGAFEQNWDFENRTAIDLTTSKEIIAFLRKRGVKTKEERDKEFDEYCISIEQRNKLRDLKVRQRMRQNSG